MYIPVWESSPDAVASLIQSSSAILPVLILFPSTIATLPKILLAICSFDISRLNIATPTFACIAAFVAIFNANADFPIAGLAATSIKSELWRPAVLLSKSINPVGTPVTCCFLLYKSSSSVKESTKISLIDEYPVWFLFCITLKIFFSALSIISSTSWVGS